jgi:hypothetical protein
LFLSWLILLPLSISLACVFHRSTFQTETCNELQDGGRCFWPVLPEKKHEEWAKSGQLQHEET